MIKFGDTMPIYDLKCPSCGRVTKDLLLGLSEPLPLCKECKVPMKKLIVPNARMSENWAEWQKPGSKK